MNGRIKATVAAVWAIAKATCFTAITRIAIWLIGVSVALYPALHQTNLTPSWSPREIAEQINQAGNFGSFFFVILVGTVISMTNLLDNMLNTGSANIPQWQKTFAIAAFAADIIVLIYGTGHFGSITAALPPEQFAFNWGIVKAVLGLQILIELIISYRNAGVITTVNPLR